ncbi:MAG: hypothetical protein M1831_006963 [Alyxoria varia]|nr:MAG: hypothetical protein M1831_006963 [Alyxoria varia]
MDGYPDVFIAENYPLIVLSGFDDNVLDEHQGAIAKHPLQKNGIKIGSDAEPLSHERAKSLLSAFLNYDIRTFQHREGLQDQRKARCTFKICGRRYSLPCRKASPQPSPAESPLEAPLSSLGSGLHSPLSPTSPGSVLHPDGIVTSLWNAKHQEIVPGIFLAFFAISCDPNQDSLHDDHLKNEIVAIRSSIEQSHYRTRLAVVFMGDESTTSSFNASDLQERITNIKKAARLDNTNAFFFPYDTDPAEFGSFAARVLSNIRPICIEYYRDLTKHGRRKRDKGSNPLIPQGIPRLGWVCRYEYKLGIFAEFRDEMDVAERHYVAALDALFNPQGPFQSISDWSPRFNEARLLSDVIACRLIRCQLTANLPNAAVQSWTSHARRTTGLVRTKGKGTATYGFLAWQTRWTKIMSELIGSSFPVFSSLIDSDADEASREVLPIQYAPRERTVQGDQQIDPWDYLHHAGYWLLIAARLMRQRRDMARKIPEEDRTPPGQSPASRVSRKSEIYESYLCVEPHMEYQLSNQPDGFHNVEIASLIEQAIPEFAGRRQRRMADYARLQLCHNLVEMDRKDEAMRILTRLWKKAPWRQGSWAKLIQEVLAVLNQCSVDTDDHEMRIASLWELYARGFDRIQDVKYDLQKLSQENSKDDSSRRFSVLELADDNVESFCDIDFSFANAESHVGEPTAAQLVLRSKARPKSLPVTFSNINVEFSNSSIVHTLKVVHNQPRKDTPWKSTFSHVELKDAEQADHGDSTSPLPNFIGSCDLTLRPEQTSIIELLFYPSDVGELAATRSIASMSASGVQVQFSKTIGSKNAGHVWLLPRAEGIEVVGSSGSASSAVYEKILPRDGSRIQIHPRPPRLNVTMAGIREEYYTDERVDISVELFNGEDEDADVNLAVESVTESEESDAAHLAWSDNGHMIGNSEHTPTSFINSTIGRLSHAQQTSKIISVHFPKTRTSLRLEVRADYYLSSEPSKPISKNFTASVTILRPFEAKYSINPSYHPSPWPSYFAMEEEENDDDDWDPLAADRQYTAGDIGSSKPCHAGLTTRWHCSIDLLSFARQPLHISRVGLTIPEVSDGSSCTVSEGARQRRDFEMDERSQAEGLDFIFDLMKREMDDRRQAGIRPVVEVEWRRKAGEDDAEADMQQVVDSRSKCSYHCTLIPLPELSLHVSEPRVIAVASKLPHTIPPTTTSDPPSEGGSAGAAKNTDPKLQTGQEEAPNANANAITLDIHLENPSSYHLTFQYAMESSEHFAFSGAKLATCSLLPLSRKRIRYNLLPFSDGGGGEGDRDRGSGEGKGGGGDTGVVDTGHWIYVPFRVMDVYFKKVLLVTPSAGSELLSVDEEGALMVRVGTEV